VSTSKPQADEQNDSTNETQLPGRDSGFCSEQDQHQQTQGETSIIFIIIIHV